MTKRFAYLLVLGWCLAIASGRGAAAAHAQGTASAATSAEASKQRYDAEVARLIAAGRKVATLEAAYAKQTTEVARLKKLRSSWRRDRDLEKALASSLEGAKALEIAQRASAGHQRQVDSARLALLAAIKRELPLANEERRRRLLAWQAGVTPRPSTQKIVMPDLTFYPDADPEDLLQQAADIRQTEAQLGREIALLEGQAKRWAALAELRDTQRRSSDVASLQGTDARRLGGGAAASSQSETSPPPSGENPTPPPGPQDEPPAPAPGPTEQAPGLGDVGGGVTANTAALGSILSSDLRKELAAAELSRDPQARAKALLAAQRAAAARLELLRKHRALIEQHAAKNK